MNVFTVDVDWAPEPVIADTLALFEQFGVKCTIFATHRSPIIESCDRELFEIGIHPNFNGLLAGKNGDPTAILDELLTMYPEACGIRSHSMAQSSPLLDQWASKGMMYEANHFLPYWSNIRPFRLWNGLLRVPYNWEDDIHFRYGRSFDDAGLDSAAELNILVFHPVHVYLNSDTAAGYSRARSCYQDADKLLVHRNNDRPGTRTLLIRLLEQQGDSLTLRSLAAQQQAP
jgi:hypothetical protein